MPKRKELATRIVNNQVYYYIPSHVKWKCSCGGELDLQARYDVPTKLSLNWVADGTLVCELCDRTVEMRVWFEQLSGQSTKVCPCCQGIGRVPVDKGAPT